MPSSFPHLIVRRTAVRQTPLTPARNIFAIQSALIRGDRVVTLHNTSRILPEHYNKVRVPYHPEDMPQDRPLDWPFGDQYSDSRSSQTYQPRSVGHFIELLNWDGFRLEWIKVLGEGGFGMATLWDAIFEDQSRVKIVIKIPVRANTDFDSELDWHLKYGGASHVTQSLDLQAMADSVRRRINRGHMIDRGPRFVQTNMDVLVLEYAERGSLYEMMAKASYFSTNFSNKVLWEIWECLVKGVISAALQPDAAQRWGHDGLDKVLDSLDDPRNIDELLRISTLVDSHDVHLDLEEQNVLVSEDAQHSHHPIFKLHDFGHFSNKMRECWDHWKEADYWRVRKCPKINRTPPETISKEWDKIDLSNPGQVSRYAGDFFGPAMNEVAGRYGTWTNIFMIGKIMESVITKHWVGHPMTTMNYTAQDQRCTGPSYGWRICRPDYSYIDSELLDLIVQCQYERPADRPHLDYILRKICERKHHGFQEHDYETRDFWDDFWARTKTTPAPLSQGSMIAVPAPGNQGNSAASLASTFPFAQDSDATNRHTSPSAYAQTGNPLIMQMAGLRRKSRRSLLSVSSAESSISLCPRIADPAANPPPGRSDSASGIQRKRPSSADDSSGEEPLRRARKKRSSASSSQSESTSSARWKAKKQKRVRFDGSPASASLIMTTAGNVMDTSMDDSPGSLNRAWPVVSNRPIPTPDILDADEDTVRDLSSQYGAISPQRPDAPQNDGRAYLSMGSPEELPKHRASMMDVDEGGDRDETMDED